MSETTNLSPLFYDPNRDSRPNLQTSAPLPMSSEEVQARGWTEVDVVFITGDAYVDSPSFANGLLTRVLEKDGFKVAVLSQPNWNSVDDFRKFGKPRLAFCVSAGNMDSMINHYTANRKVRNDDAYSPGGKIGKRPDRATLAYCQRAREAFPGVPVITGGVEASLRRIAHYDYWSDRVRRSIVLDSKADLLIYGMGERPLLEILRRLDKEEEIKNIRNVRGTVYRLGKNEDLPEESETIAHLPSFDDVSENEKVHKLRFVKMTQLAFENLNPYCAKTLIQEHGDEAIVVNPPAFPLSEDDMDAVYSLPFTRKAHPSYQEPIPAVEVVRSSVQTHRGCFGGCTFCAITAHQGKFVQPRSERSILSEIKNLAEASGGDYVVGDLSAPTANMYRMGGKNQDACSKCIRTSCLCPQVCPNLNVDHTAYIGLLKSAREQEGVKSVLIASGIRTDLANFSPEFIDDLAAYHTGGHLKTAPEHVDDEVLTLMNKPPIANYEMFCELFDSASQKAGKEQYLVPYLIAGFPGCTLSAMVQVAEYLKAHDIRPEQVQDFIPAPFQLATCAYYTGVDPVSEESIYVPRGLRERRLQRALLLYYSPELYHDVKSALKEAHREDLIGNDENSLIPSYPSKASALRQTSRIKRLQRKEEREKIAKEKRRSEFEGYDDSRSESRSKRVGRERTSSSVGGYRASSRDFGASSRYSVPRVWNPIDKVWEKVEEQEDPRRPSSRRSNDSKRKEFGGKYDHDRFRSDRSFSKARNKSSRRFESDSSDGREFRLESDDSPFRRRNDVEGEEFRRDGNEVRQTEERSERRSQFQRSEKKGRFQSKGRFNQRSDRFSSNRSEHDAETRPSYRGRKFSNDGDDSNVSDFRHRKEGERSFSRDSQEVSRKTFHKGFSHKGKSNFHRDDSRGKSAFGGGERSSKSFKSKKFKRGDN